MQITRHMVAEKIAGYLRHELTLGASDGMEKEYLSFGADGGVYCMFCCSGV